MPETIGSGIVYSITISALKLQIDLFSHLATVHIYE